MLDYKSYYYSQSRHSLKDQLSCATPRGLFCGGKPTNNWSCTTSKSCIFTPKLFFIADSLKVDGAHALSCLLMGQQNKEMDVESLQKIGRRRGGCLDMFLVMSIVFLFVAVTAVAAGGVMLVLRLEPKLESSPPSFNIEASKQTGGTSFPAYKMQKFVELEATSSEVKNFTMEWAPVSFAAGTSLGSNYLFDTVQSLLKPKREGMYFIYIDLNLTCTFKCDAGLLTVHVGDKLTCEVKLPEVANSTPVSKKCWTVSRITKGQGLLAQMTVPEAGLENWRLEMSSRFGMFLVD